MGSYDVAHYAHDGKIHVAWSKRDRCWWVVGAEGSYGMARLRAVAIDLAKDAVATGRILNRKIVIHAKSGKVAAHVNRVRQKGSPLWFQDSLP